MGVILCFRIGTGLAIAALAALSWTAFGWEASLSVAISAMAGFVLLQTAVSYAWARSLTADGVSKATNMHADAAKLAITTQGIVLGLISFSAPDETNATLKVAGASLAAGVLVGVVLYLLVAQQPPPPGRHAVFASILLALLLWALGFGLICVVAGSW